MDFGKPDTSGPRQYVLSQKERLRALKESHAAIRRPVTNPNAPGYNPHHWLSKHDTNSLNCYEYAVAGVNNRTSPGLPNPGETKFIYNIFDIKDGMPQFTPELLKKFAAADGMIPAGNQPPPAKPGHYVVAGYLAKYPSGVTADYHWIRQDADGHWSQKFGKEPVGMVKDAKGRPVSSAPDKMRDYDRVGYFYVPKEGLAVGYGTQLNNIQAGKHMPLEIPPEAKKLEGIASMPAGVTITETIHAMLKAHDGSIAAHTRSILRYINDIAREAPQLEIAKNAPDYLKGFIDPPAQAKPAPKKGNALGHVS